MFKKIIKNKNYRKAFMSGFHYGVKNYQMIEDKHFFIYENSDKDNQIASFQHVSYRQGIRLARNYMLYRYEILTIFILLFTTFLFITTW